MQKMSTNFNRGGVFSRYDLIKVCNAPAAELFELDEFVAPVEVDARGLF